MGPQPSVAGEDTEPEEQALKTGKAGDALHSSNPMMQRPYQQPITNLFCAPLSSQWDNVGENRTQKKMAQRLGISERQLKLK